MLISKKKKNSETLIDANFRLRKFVAVRGIIASSISHNFVGVHGD